MLITGKFLSDRYEIIELIGSGGMAEVYKGKDHMLNRFVAIKVMKQEFSADRSFVSKFRVEAQSAAGLTDKNIVSIYDVGEDQGYYYIVMELVEGITLKRYIEKKGRLTVKETITIAMQISMGLEMAHNNHIIHRDIKPQNIVISKDGKVKITDFGIAKASTSNTVSSTVMGSVHYTSPEQARGGYSTEKSDIYSLGITMYEMLAGYPPFDGDNTVSIAVRHLQDPLPDIREAVPDIPLALEKIIEKCTMKTPERRYANMGELIADLKQCLLTPDQDFVKTVTYGEGKTTRISKDDMAKIKEHSSKKSVNANSEQRDNKRPKEDDGDEELNPKLEKTLTILGAIAALIVLAIAVFAVVSLVRSLGGTAPKATVAPQSAPTAQPTEDVPEGKVKMINVLGMTEEEALQELNSRNLGMDATKRDFSNDYEKGQVMFQSVDVGTMIDKNTTIEVTISKGPTALQAPDVIGKSESDARKQIEEMGLVFAVADNQYNNDYPIGQVISTTPEKGQEINKGDTVSVVISRGPEKVSVPDLYNMTPEEAANELEKFGLVLGATDTSSKYDDSVEAGKILSQNYKVGSSVEKGTAINVVLSKGAEEEEHIWSGSVKIPKSDLPDGFESGQIKLELSQEVDSSQVTKTILDQALTASDFPYTMQITGATGVSTGQVALYIDGVKSGNYSVIFNEE